MIIFQEILTGVNSIVEQRYIPFRFPYKLATLESIDEDWANKKAKESMFQDEPASQALAHIFVPYPARCDALHSVTDLPVLDHFLRWKGTKKKVEFVSLNLTLRDTETQNQKLKIKTGTSN